MTRLLFTLLLPLIFSSHNASCGSEGKRAQLVYAYFNDHLDHYVQAARIIEDISYGVDDVYEQSAQRHTGGSRSVRWVSNSNCDRSVMRIEMPASNQEMTYQAKAYLIHLGYTSEDRKYLIFVDVVGDCGWGDIQDDSRPGPENKSNHTVGYAFISRFCWNIYTASHELTHMLGAIQNDAPNSDWNHHCWEEWDLMCYPLVGFIRCDLSNARLLDCNGDDYFNTNPRPGSYLATHWNVANSMFLNR